MLYLDFKSLFLALQVQNETFCVKFKTVDEADKFREAFEKGRELSKLAKSPSKPEAVSSQPPAATSASTTTPATKPAFSGFEQPATFGTGQYALKIV